MSSDENQVQNVYRYSRKTIKKNIRGSRDDDQDNINIEVDTSSLNDVRNGAADSARCSCEPDPDEEITTILHKKCPVISLAEQQLRRLLDETDRFMCDNTRCCRSVYEFLWLCKEIISQSKCRCLLIAVIMIAFFMGVLFGAASCGTYLGRFNSPLLDCVDTFFIPDSYPKLGDTYYSIF